MNTPLGTPESEAKLHAAIMSEEPAEAFATPEIDNVRELNDWLDDPQGSMPDEFGKEVDALLSVAWYITEEFIRYNTGKCSSTATRKDEHEPETAAPFTCQCCRYFHSLTGRANHLRGFLR